MRNNLTTSDIFDVNRKTGGLILGKNRLDDYASKYLSHVCKEALTTPMPLPIEQILADAHLTVIEVSLSKNLDIFGCCLLLDGEVQVYNKATGRMELRGFPAGTILIDPDYADRYGEGAKRNTLIHEALHWEKDQRYFEILQIKNRVASEKLYPIMCRQSETYYVPPEGKKTKENEVRWLEWQAHRLAPRVLMPHEMFKKKALEIIEHPDSENIGLPLSCDSLIERISEFFLVSRSSAKYRLIEVGMETVISQFDDYADVYAEILESKSYQPLNPIEAYSLALNDSVFSEWIGDGSFIYADGYFVLASPQYAVFKDGIPHLTTKAKKNLSQCVLNIREQRCVEYTYACKDFEGLSYLYRSYAQAHDADRRIYLFDPKLQANFEELDPTESYAAAYNSIPAYDEDEESKLLGMLAMPNKTLCQCLWFLLENRHWTAPSTFSEYTGLHENYHGKIKKDQYNNMGTDVLMAICIGLQLRLWLIEQVFEKSQNKLTRYQDPDKTYIRILERFPGVTLNDFNGMLTAAKLPELGTKGKDS